MTSCCFFFGAKRPKKRSRLTKGWMGEITKAVCTYVVYSICVFDAASRARETHKFFSPFFSCRPDRPTELPQPIPILPSFLFVHVTLARNERKTWTGPTTPTFLPSKTGPYGVRRVRRTFRFGALSENDAEYPSQAPNPSDAQRGEEGRERRLSVYKQRTSKKCL